MGTMMLQKQAFPLNFAQGLDTKTDPFQLSMGSFNLLKNSVFSVGKRLTKRNGYGSLADLPFAASFTTTFNGDLTAIGSQIGAYLSGSESWVTKGNIEPLDLQTLPLIRNNLNQTQCDAAISANGLVCTVYTESNGSSDAFKYAVADATTGQNIIAPTVLDADSMYGMPRVFYLGVYFLVVYAKTTDLNFVAISSLNPSSISAPISISSDYGVEPTQGFDGVVLNSYLYMAWQGASANGINVATVGTNLSVSAAQNHDATHFATAISVCADATTQTIWVSYYDEGATTGYTFAMNTQLAILASFPVKIIDGPDVLNLASAAQNGVMTVFYEVDNTTNYVESVTVIQTTAVVSSPIIKIRSLGLASKAFIIDGVIYFLGAFDTQYQPSYFLINGSLSTSASPVIVGKLAYENGGGYLPSGLPSVSVNGTTASIAYLYKDLVQALSDANAAGTSVVGGIYSQTGINLASFNFSDLGLVSSEIGQNLNVSGGFVWAYDGYLPVEQGFHLWPDPIPSATTASTTGHLTAQIYFYQFTYEWTDNQGNAFRSAGSIPKEVDLSGSGTSTNKVTFAVPTLRVTAKTANPVKIVGYRWSTEHPTFYQFTSITAPTLNSTTVDSVNVVDTLADTSIIGNNILYTTGGVIENIGPPGCSAMTLFDDRIWIVDAEDRNLLWFSKQVIESTPVEMSDLLTIYVAPTIGATGPTGPMTALSAMDDKIVIFKQNAAYYINGTGPDNTGANNQYSNPTFITSMVGCSNQRSIVFQPQGLMFEFASEAGNQIWLLGRDLQTQYIGAPVEGFMEGATVLSSLAVPGTNQVRFNLSNGITLMYDYFFSQWGTFSTSAVSSTLYQGLHTYINAAGAVFQETPGVYLDGTTPVTMEFTTGWINTAGLRGYQRAFFFFLLGQYFSPFKLLCAVAYDYESGPTSFATINPTNFTPVLGGAEANGQITVLGSGTPLGGKGNILNWRVFFKKQRCSSFQINIREVYDPAFGVPAGEGFSLSGLSLICAVKSGFKTIGTSHTVGAS